MPRPPKAIVLDSWSIIAYLEKEPSEQKVAGIIADAHENEIPLMLSVVNAGEVWYILARETSDTEADQNISQLDELGIELVNVDWKLTRSAAAIKAKNKMSYADSFAAALAKQTKAHLVTGDPEFKQVETELPILWI